MPIPIVTITNLSLSKLSDESGFQNATLTFHFDIDISEYTVRCGGTDHLTGINCQSDLKNVGSLSSNLVGDITTKTVRDIMVFPSIVNINANIDYTELASEGTNQINIYGKSITDEWSTYQMA